MVKDKKRLKRVCGLLKTFRFVFSASIDIQAVDFEEAKQKFFEAELVTKDIEYRDVMDTFEVDKNGREI